MAKGKNMNNMSPKSDCGRRLIVDVANSLIGKNQKPISKEKKQARTIRTSVRHKIDNRKKSI